MVPNKAQRELYLFAFIIEQNLNLGYFRIYYLSATFLCNFCLVSFRSSLRTRSMYSIKFRTSKIYMYRNLFTRFYFTLHYFALIHTLF
jgi:hypothetical protein